MLLSSKLLLTELTWIPRSVFCCAALSCSADFLPNFPPCLPPRREFSARTNLWVSLARASLSCGGMGTPMREDCPFAALLAYFCRVYPHFTTFSCRTAKFITPSRCPSTCALFRGNRCARDLKPTVGSHVFCRRLVVGQSFLVLLTWTMIRFKLL